jgi:hypothetical protein
MRDSSDGEVYSRIAPPRSDWQYDRKSSSNYYVRRFLVCPMKRILTIAACVLGILFAGRAGIAGIASYLAFHSGDRWISRSPANSRWVVDIVTTGLIETGQDFRVHDLRASPLRPRRIRNLFWYHHHRPNEIHWSRDGSVAAITIGFEGKTGYIYGCAYDFIKHQPVVSDGLGNGTEPSADFTASIDQLLAARGGVGSIVAVPDALKIPSHPFGL